MASLFGQHRLLTKKVFDEIYIPEKDRDNYNTVQASEALEGKIVCLFFSASWCTPCQHFVPTLKEVYSELAQRNSPLEVVFLSFDKTEDEMMNYYQEKHGDWLTVKFEDPLKQELVERYAISVIPKLIVIQPDGEIISNKGRKDVQDRGVICMRTWQAGFDRYMHHDKEQDNKEQEGGSNNNDNATIIPPNPS